MGVKSCNCYATCIYFPFTWHLSSVPFCLYLIFFYFHWHNKTLFDLKLSKCLCRNSWRKNLAMKTLFSGLLVKTSGISQILKRYVRKSFWEIATRDIITVAEKLYLKDCYNYENFSFLLFSVFLSLFDFLIFSSNKVSLCDE